MKGKLGGAVGTKGSAVRWDSLEDLARECFEEAAPKSTDRPEGDREVRYFAAGIGICVASVLFSAPWLAPLGFLCIGAPFAQLFLPVRIRYRRQIARRLAAFHSGDPEAFQTVCSFALDSFRRQINDHRARAIGRDSEWGAARDSLVQARDDAQRSVSYWDLRAGQEPDNDFAARQRDAASALETKLKSALDHLDARADVLLRFYNDCEARLATMDRHNRDLEESRRLEELSGRAEMAVADAGDALAEIAGEFIREAQAVGEAIGGLAGLQAKSLAGEAPLDNIEYFADLIIEDADRELVAVERLERALHGDGTVG